MQRIVVNALVFFLAGTHALLGDDLLYRFEGDVLPLCGVGHFSTVCWYMPGINRKWPLRTPLAHARRIQQLHAFHCAGA